MLNILYTQEPNGKVFTYTVTPNDDKQSVCNWILDQGYELVGES